MRAPFSDTIKTTMVPTGDHFNGRRFFNPDGPPPQPQSAVPRMLLERRTPWPRQIDVQPQRPPPLDGARAIVTFIGHATFLIQTPAGNFLTDPMYSQRAGPFNLAGPRRVRQPAVRFDDLPPISTVLLSHNHYDHCDLRTLRTLAKRFDPLVITPIGNARLVRSTGIRRVEELDWPMLSGAPRSRCAISFVRSPSMARTSFTKPELQILEVLWTRGACSIREIHEALPAKGRPAFTTIQTVVYRLEKKHALRCVKRISNANIIEAVVSRDEAHGTLVDELLSLFGGRSRPAMARLVETGRLTLDDIKEAEDALKKQLKKGRSRVERPFQN